jgi:hypothetical protein
MLHLAAILLPIKKAILKVENHAANLADCYLSLLMIGVGINSISTDDYHIFKNHCIDCFNKRYLLILLNKFNKINFLCFLIYFLLDTKNLIRIYI